MLYSRLKIFTLIIIFVLKINAQNISFNHLTVEDGLSNNDVNTLIQDHTGFIWFGTEDGLNRYDGYNFKIFRYDPSDTNSLSGNVVWSLMEDRKGYIWAGTVDGILNQFDPESEKFIRHDFAGDDKKYSSVTALFEDSKGNIWIGTRGRGIFKLNPQSKQILHFNRDKTDSLSLSHQSVRAISEDSFGNIIIGTYYGLNKFNPELPENGFRRYFNTEDDPNSMISNQVYNLSGSRADQNIIWIGTPDGLIKFNSASDSFRRIEILNPDKLQFGSGASTVIEEIVDNEKILWIDTYSGLLRMNLNSGESRRYAHAENNPFSIIDNQINKIIKDKSGVLWIATESGVSYLSTKSTKFNSVFNKNYEFYLNVAGNRKDLNAIHQNKNGDIWLGFSDGIVKLKDTGQNQHFIKSKEIDGLNVWSLTEDDNNSLWIGTFGQGLIQYDLYSNKTKEWVLRFSKINTTTVLFVKFLLKDNKNNLWVGYWGSGIAKIDLNSGNYDLWITETANPKSISYSDVWTIKEDKLGRIWIGTVGGGLNLFENKDGGIFHHWMQIGNDKNSLSSNNVYSICVAENFRNIDISESVLWIGTSNGLNKFLIKNNHDSPDIYSFDVEIKSFTVNNGLSDNTVNSILEDDNGNLWLGTGSGISFFDVTNETFINYSSTDGLIGKVMNPESALRLDNGLMLFGSKKGLNIFDPKQIKLSDFKPSVVITDFKIFNESVGIGEDSPLKQSIISSKEIILPFNKDVFSFEFAAMDYNSSQSIQYAYKMEGFDDDWINSEDRRFVTYTNLDPGTYTFMVKATNSDGVWNSDYAWVKLIVKPPWWQTSWAYISYSLLIILGLLAIRRFEMNRTRLRNELKMKQVEAEQKTKLEVIKSRFFANLSHEFRTPLMLIKGPVEQLKAGGPKHDYYGSIDLIERNSERLKELIDQLLELSQLEKAAIPLKAKQENVVTILKGLISTFESLAKQKNILLKFKCDSESQICWVDRDKFEKIINNILSNAFKFTPDGGNILVKVKESIKDEKHFTEIKISDSGIGIPEDKLDKIFDRFFQMDDSPQRSYGGSGIGLALVKELADLHKWEILVHSEEEKGTEFKLRIPMQDSYLEEDEKVKDETEVNIAENEIIQSRESKVSETEKVSFQQTVRSGSGNKPSVLIVDDSEDVRKYLTSLLINEYEISSAANGEEGIKVTAEILPDIIISDVMMPSMDGMEFCRRIKSEWQTSDIPVILLTAKASFDSRIEGLEIGADDYLTKPFNSKELFTRIKNLLDQRKRLRKKYSKDFKPVYETRILNTADDDFIKKALKLVEKNLDKTNFSTELLAKELFVSRTQLHRKIMAITEQAPGEFIRTIKLERAAVLLSEGKLSVTQIAYEIGFSSPAQFTRAFTKHFNCLPSEFSSRNKS